MRLTGFGLGLIATLLVVMAKASGLATYEYLELRAFDAFIQYRPQPPARSDIVHIDIDDQAIEQVGRWAWPRTQHAHLVETLRRLGARAVLYDIEFPDPTQPRVEQERLSEDLIGPLQQQAQGLRTGIDDLLRQLGQRPEPTVSAQEFAQVLNQVADLFTRSTQELRTHLSQALEDPDETLAQALAQAANVYLALSLPPPRDGHLNPAVARQAVELLRRDFTITAEELARALELPAGEGPRRLPINDLRQQAALIEAERLLAADPQAPLERLRRELLGAGSTSTALERMVARAYDRARSLRVVLAASRTPLPETGDEEVPKGNQVVPPVSVLTEAAAGLGVVNAVADLDGKVRRAHLFWEFRGHLLPHLSLVVLAQQLRVPLESIRLRPGVSVTLPGARLPGRGEAPRDIVIPVDRQAAALINWALAPRAVRARRPYGGSFKHVSAATVLELWDIEDVLERTYLALDQYSGGRGGPLLEQLKELERTGAEPAKAQQVRTELEGVRRDLRQFLARQVDQSERRLRASSDEAERAELRAALKPLQEDLQVLERREARRRELLDYLRPIVSGATSIVGTTFTAGTDFHPVPFHNNLPGVLLYSHLLNMVLEGRFLRRAPPAAAIAAILLSGLGAGLLSATLRASRSGFLTLLVAGGSVAVSYAGFVGWGLWLDAVGPAVTPLVAFSLVTAYRQLTEERQKRWIRNVFQHYLSPEVVTEVLEQPDLLGLRGRVQEVTIFFSDLAEFTSIAERLAPEELTQLLNDYLTPMTDIIQTHGGCLDKYEGDLIMSFFGAPVHYPDHALRACFAALGNQAHLARLREEFRRQGRPLLYARIGLATGAVRVGNMGSEMRFDYTVMGDYANLASRLEGVNKLYGTSILISESTRREAGDALCVRELDLVRVKGRAEPVRIYELLAKAGELPPEWEPLLRAYARGLDLYRRRQWQEAAQSFQQALTHRPQDRPSTVLLERCRGFLAEPPPEDWDGVFAAG